MIYIFPRSREGADAPEFEILDFNLKKLKRGLRLFRSQMGAAISVFVMQVFVVPGYRDDQDGKKNVATTGK